MAISTTIFTTETFPVPTTWIFEKFLNLTEALTGQTISMHSIFNKNDKNPSMMLYVNNNNKYKFKCFSTDKSGDGADLIQQMYGLKTRDEAFKLAMKYWTDGGYESYTPSAIVKGTFKVTDYTTRVWNTNDAAYWQEYHIGSESLNGHYIRPLASYDTQTIQGDMITNRTFQWDYCYGYFTKAGQLYKIYNPMNTRAKFIKIFSFVQGHEQLQFKGGWLIISSSMKDLLALKTLRLPNIETVAPDSENTMLTAEQIAWYCKRYDFVSVLFDGDAAGAQGALKYHQLYSIPFTTFDVEKDVAKCVKEHGVENTRLFLTPKLIKTKDEHYKKLT
jgi:hypothetical protein